MGIFDFLKGESSEASGKPGVNPAGPSWLLIAGSDAATIRAAILKHAGIAAHEEPQKHRAQIFALAGGQFAATFDPPAPPYAFVNLIGWLADSGMCRGSRGAVGWLVAPGDGTRFLLTPDPNGGLGDTLVGLAADGRQVAVFLPDCSVSLGRASVAAVTEPELPAGAAPAATFEVTFDGDTSFGNPDFEVE